ncbi:MAG: hypothetical protein IKB70_08100 [Bacilli bacterium]|nr:hypothetical protein [Bacilli bacterium]
MERYITEENMEAVVNYVTDKANLYLTEQFEKEMALWELEATWHKVLENYPKEAKEFLYRITAEVLKNDE